METLLRYQTGQRQPNFSCICFICIIIQVIYFHKFSEKVCLAPPKRGHGHGDEDVGEGSSTVKKIKIVRGKEFVCEYCGDILETAGNLKNHKKKHQTFECQNKSATNASLWKTSKDTLSVAKAQEKAFFFYVRRMWGISSYTA